jgi:hypothetical protein
MLFFFETVERMEEMQFEQQKGSRRQFIIVSNTEAQQSPDVEGCISVAFWGGNS